MKLKPRHRRMAWVAAAVAALAVAAALVLNALGSNMSWFITPTEVAVAGISIMTPRAPLKERASRSHCDSWYPIAASKRQSRPVSRPAFSNQGRSNGRRVSM